MQDKMSKEHSTVKSKLTSFQSEHQYEYEQLPSDGEWYAPVR
jgi:hypothetical protein